MEEKEKIERALDKYVKNAGIESLRYRISSDFNVPHVQMYLQCFLDEKTKHVTPIGIVFNKSHVHDRYFDLSLCHELGHVKSLLKGKDFIERKNLWQHIVSEVRADREAATIYNQPEAVKKDMIIWISRKIKWMIKNIYRKEYKDFIWKDLALNVARLIAVVVNFKNYRI
jgi:hypothetical protein